MPRAPEAVPLADAMLERLASVGGWLDREALAAGLSCCPAAIDDALADLVLEKRALYRAGVGYRLAGTELCRAAVKQLKAQGLLQAVCGRQVGREYHIGVAQAFQSLGLVMYELTMPLPSDADAQLAQVVGVLAAFEKGVCHATA